MADTDPDGLTHLDAAGHARMVDVSAKDRTVRVAEAQCFVTCSVATLERVRAGSVPKGDVLAVARIAGIAAAKATPQIIPLCHPVALAGVEVDVSVTDGGLAIHTKATACDRTGVEMEALTAAAAAALTAYDMLKAVERGICIDGLRLLTKSGGRSGDWAYAAPTPAEPAQS